MPTVDVELIPLPTTDVKRALVREFTHVMVDEFGTAPEHVRIRFMDVGGDCSGRAGVLYADIVDPTPYDSEAWIDLGYLSNHPARSWERLAEDLTEICHLRSGVPRECVRIRFSPLDPQASAKGGRMRS